jgi:hypothetical protein
VSFTRDHEVVAVLYLFPSYLCVMVHKVHPALDDQNRSIKIPVYDGQEMEAVILENPRECTGRESVCDKSVSGSVVVMILRARASAAFSQKLSLKSRYLVALNLSSFVSPWKNPSPPNT